MTRLLMTATCVLALFSLVGMSEASTSERAERFRQRGAEHLQAGRHSAAILEFRNAVQLEPRNPAYHRALAKALALAKDSRGAFRAYQDVVTLDPDDVEARLQVAVGNLLGGRFEEAAFHAEKVVELAPDRFDGYAVLARARLGLRDGPAALASMERAIELAPDSEPLRLELAKVHLALKNPARTEQTLREGLRDLPSSRMIRLMLANHLLENGLGEGADILMGEFLHLSPGDPEAYKILAAYRLKRSDPAGAESLLTQALQIVGEPSDARVEILSDLVDLYSLYGQLSRARECLEEIRRLAPDNRIAAVRLAEFDLLEGQVGKAEVRVAELFRENPAARDVRVLRARLDLLQGKEQEAIHALEAIVKEDPGDSLARLFLANAYTIAERWNEARRGYLGLLEVFPDDLALNLGLARACLALGRPKEAMEPLDRVLKAKPDLHEAKDLRAVALLSLGRASEAASEYRGLLQAKPEIARFEIGLGRSLEAEGHFSEAVKHYRAAQELKPSEPESVLRMMALFSRLDQGAELERTAAAYLASQGDVPVVLNALVFHALQRGDREAARGYLERSLAADGKAADTRELEARVLMEEGRHEEARSTLLVLLETLPQRVSVQLLLAASWEVSGRPDKAIPLYEQMLRIDATNAVAANNLSVILLRDEAKLNEALQLAQMAVRNDPSNLLMKDTLGWVHFRMQSYELARRMLEEARSGLPSHSEVAFHLGMTYERLGERQKARRLLLEALDGTHKGDWAIEAAETLNRLGQKRRF